MKTLPVTRTLSVSLAVTILSVSATAWSAWVGGVSGTAATMLATAGDDSIMITTEGSAWLAHNRFDAGDPGFVSNIDFDSSIAGEQRIPNNDLGSLSLFAGAGNDTLNVRDGFFINPNNLMEITNNTIYLGADPGGNRPRIFYDGFQSVHVTPQGPSNTGVRVSSTGAGISYALAGRPDQIYEIGDPATQSLDSIQGPISIDGGGFFDLNDSGDTSDNVYTTDGFNTITRTGMADLDLFLTSQIRIFAGSGHNQFLVRGNSNPDFQFNGNGGTNDITFGNAAGTLNDIREPVQINRFGDALENVVFNDTGQNAGHEYTIGNFGLVRDAGIIAEGPMDAMTLNCGPLSDTIWTLPGERIHINGGAGTATDILVSRAPLFPSSTIINGDTSTISNGASQPISFDAIDYLFVFGGSESNEMTILPSADYPITVDAGDPTISPADSLTLQGNGQHFTLSDDTFSVQGKKPVTFTGFETISSPPPSPGVDLTGTFLSVTLTPRKNNKFRINAQFSEANIGTVLAGKSVTRFFLSADTTLDASDIPLKSQKIKLIAAGQQLTVTLKKNSPKSINPVGQFLIARVDDTNQLFDDNLDNNVIVFGPLF